MEQIQHQQQQIEQLTQQLHAMQARMAERVPNQDLLLPHQ